MRGARHSMRRPPFTGTTAPVMYAEMQAKLWKRTRTRVGRHWTYERADAETMLHYWPK